MFNRKASKVLGFLTSCRLNIRINIRETIVEKQIQQRLLYVQEDLADIQKENIIEDLKSRELEYVIIGEFLINLKKKFGGGDNKMIKVVELKKMEQGGRIMEEFVQEF